MIAPSEMSKMIDVFDTLSDLVVVQHQEAKSSLEEHGNSFYEADLKAATERMETLLRALDPYADLCIGYMLEHPEDFSMKDGYRGSRVFDAYEYAGLVTDDDANGDVHQ
jgi:hypothetical protein